ncbi:cyclase family protein [Paraburkholderia sediminicola]|uniref:cyclase family protein n=1 Tax=Paraburkholderia sediminicola TaxID=458836 RepID=UPI0038B747D4
MNTEHLRFIDLSVALENDVPADPPGLRPRIQYTDHQRGAEQITAMFPGLSPDQLPDGEGWAVEDLVLHTHSGTHMDAPLHYASTMNGGERAIGIDELPLDWCMAPGVKLDFRALPDGHVVRADEVEAELARIGHVLKPRDIVLVNTAAARAYGTPAYIDSGCGMGRAATLYLLERGVRVVGTDAWSWDAPFRYTREAYLKSGDPSIIWEGHKAGREIGYGQLEKLTNLDLLPPFGFTVCCFPYKIKGASAGFTRAVAIIDTEPRS